MGAVAAVATIITGVGAAGAVLGAAQARKASAPPPPPATNIEQSDDEAVKASKRRRAMYSGMGRSSTILTGPMGLTDTEVAKKIWPNQQESGEKTLLGL